MLGSTLGLTCISACTDAYADIPWVEILTNLDLDFTIGSGSRVVLIVDFGEGESSIALLASLFLSALVVGSLLLGFD